jgi:hypothetical protein
MSSLYRFAVRVAALPGALARVLDTVRLFDELPLKMSSQLDTDKGEIAIELDLGNLNEATAAALARRLQRGYCIIAADYMQMPHSWPSSIAA